MELAERFGRCELTPQADFVLEHEREELIPVRNFQAVASGHGHILARSAGERRRPALAGPPAQPVLALRAGVYSMDGDGLWTTAAASSSVRGAADSSQAL